MLSLPERAQRTIVCLCCCTKLGLDNVGVTVVVCSLVDGPLSRMFFGRIELRAHDHVRLHRIHDPDRSADVTRRTSTGITDRFHIATSRDWPLDRKLGIDWDVRRAADAASEFSTAEFRAGIIVHHDRWLRIRARVDQPASTVVEHHPDRADLRAWDRDAGECTRYRRAPFRCGRDRATGRRR